MALGVTGLNFNGTRSNRVKYYGTRSNRVKY